MIGCGAIARQYLDSPPARRDRDRGGGDRVPARATAVEAVGLARGDELIAALRLGWPPALPMPVSDKSERESGSGGRTRTYDQAVNSRPLYH